MAQVSPIQQATGNALVFEDSTEVPAPINEVYNRWNNFQRFPEFMKNVEEVRPLGDNRYHWVARIFGVKQKWDAEATENEPPRRISWRSITGPYNSGTVNFTSLGDNRTQVRLHMEYAPPGGKVGQVADQLTQTTKREVHEDLENFRKAITGEPIGTKGMIQGMQQQTTSGLGTVLGPLTVPIASSVAGGIAAYMIGKRLRESRAYAKATSPVALPNAAAGWALTGAAAASVLGSAALRSRGRTSDALFVGQWAPTFLGMGILARILGHRSVQTKLPTSVTSWTYVASSLGSIATSAMLYARGRRDDALFVGQWVPTFLSAALFTRLFNRLRTR
jgi:uncharacterized membrane protein